MVEGKVPLRARSPHADDGDLSAPTAADGAGDMPPITPVMAQYLAIRERHPDCLLFFRMGDFFELFFDDAVTAAGVLDIALTKRGKHRGNDIPMCGVPVHSCDTYLARLIRAGHKVAICEQTEDPAAARRRGSRAVVERDVVRVVTAGTLTEDTLLDSRRHNYLAALAETAGGCGLAWIDMSTGDFVTQAIELAGVDAALARLEPSELLVAEPLLQRAPLFETWAVWRDRLTLMPASRFDSINGRSRLEALFGVGALDGFGAFTRAETAAAGALVDYVALTQKGRLPPFQRPRRLTDGAVLEIDGASRRNLELTRTLGGQRRGSLLDTVDRTATAAGARLLADRLTAPLTDPSAIEQRLDMVQFFVDAAATREHVRALLKRCPDLDRALSRLAIGRGGPRDLAAVRDALRLTAELGAMLQAAPLPGVPRGIAAEVGALGHHEPLVDRLSRALAADLPLMARDGGFVADHHLDALDEQRRLRDDGRRVVVALQTRYAEETGVATLKIRHNNVLGYFIEVPARHADKLPAGPFFHRQTIASAARFSTTELVDLEDRISRAGERALALELALFDDLVGEVVGRAEAIGRAAAALAALDVASAFAELAVDARLCRPVVTDGLEFEVREGRHPVVEAALAARDGSAFVANDCDLGPDRRLWLLTGPNMAGKSTFLRQNALIAVLAQAGSFVPASSTRIGVVDRLFSRIGAGDELARGRSTFMVEMVETAAILHQASARSLVIFDEIGRGTATFDGLSIAWAVVEHVHDVARCRTLFATHYHELTTLAAKLDALACFTMQVKEWQGSVVFLHEVRPGAADRSYGIHVGKLAGLPPAVVHRAEQILHILEKGEPASSLARLADDLPLFAAATRPPPEPPKSPILDALAAARPDEMTPRQALELLYRWKSML
jgi:DNA mismatch repair protein MutS